MTSPTKSLPYEEKQIRCPKLGGSVTFEYCLVERQERPCQRALICWSVHFDVEGYFREKLTQEEFEECFLKPQASRLTTLMELIENAKNLATKKAND